MGYVFLAAAVVAEVIGTLSLRASEGFSKPPYAVATVIGYVGALTLLTLALQRDLPLGIAYGIWAATGVAAVAVLSVPLFGESLSALQAGGLVLVVLGVFALEVGAAH